MKQRILRKLSNAVEVFAPAKINLFLTVTGLRSDGFHDLCTVMVKMSIGDHVFIRRLNESNRIIIRCPGFEELENSENLVHVAVRKWLVASGQDFGVEILLKKDLPPMSGLGGGSSDAACALIGMNELAEEKLPIDTLMNLARETGSDCPAFLIRGPCFAEGRGEIVRPLEFTPSKSLMGKKVFLFRPEIGLSTAEIYRQFSGKFEFSSKKWSMKRVASWKSGDLHIDEFLHNDLEKAVFARHRYFNPLFEIMEKRFGLNPRMSGSGSCSFALIPDEFDDMKEVKEEIRRAWGENAWMRSGELID